MDDNSLTEILDGLLASGSPFAIYHLPGAQTIRLIEPVRVTQPGSLSKAKDARGFIAAPFDLHDDECPLLMFAEDRVTEFATDSITADDNHNGRRFDITEITETGGETRQAYEAAFGRFYAALSEKRFDKLVLARRKSYGLADRTALTVMFCRALHRYPTAFTYMFHSETSGTWMGATPEMLLRGDRHTLRTVALAGTRTACDGTADRPWDDKNTAEQAYVSRYIANTLHSLGIECRATGPHTLRAGHLEHLCTEFEFDLTASTDRCRIIEALHPTPAVCGLHKGDAFAFINANEPCRRTYYSGFVGALNAAGDTDLFVNLRCLNVKDRTMQLYAGGGIILGSIVNNEWEETRNKMQTMLTLAI